MMSLAIGLVVSAALPLAVVFLLITVIGAPLAVFLVALALFLVVFGSLWADIAVGKRVLELFGYDDDKLYGSLFAGKLIRSIITLVPCVGLIYSMVTGWAVIGAAVRMKFEKVKVASKTTAAKSRRTTKRKSGKRLNTK